MGGEYDITEIILSYNTAVLCILRVPINLISFTPSPARHSRSLFGIPTDCDIIVPVHPLFPYNRARILRPQKCIRHPTNKFIETKYLGNIGKRLPPPLLLPDIPVNVINARIYPFYENKREHEIIVG